MGSPEITYQREQISLGVEDYQKSLINPNHIEKKTGEENT
jgi:hypothetical protein